MIDAVRNYLRLGLRLGRHVEGLVDAYYGPARLAEEVASERLVRPSELARDADALATSLAASSLEPPRKAWLVEQTRALGVQARVLAGEQLSYLDEVEGYYGVRPSRTDEDVFEVAHAQLAELLPGTGDLASRYEAFQEAHTVPRELVADAFAAIAPILRRRTAEIVDLPEGERFDVEAVEGRPWLAFNYYRGDLTSRIEVNVDLPVVAVELTQFVAHEAYPGHHTERACKEAELVSRRSRREETIVLVPTPQSLVAEGIAELGVELVVDEATAVESAAALAALGVRYDPARALAVLRAREPLRFVGGNVALMIHEDGASEEEAFEYAARWSLATPDRARHIVTFVTDPAWRSYVSTYTEGLRLCKTWVRGDPRRFRRLLTEQITVAELRSVA